MSWQNDYNRAVLRARNLVMGSNGKTAEVYLAIYRAIADALIDLDFKSDVGVIRKTIVRRNMLQMLERMQREIQAIIDATRSNSMRLIIEAHRQSIENAIRATGIRIPESTLSGLNATRIIPNALEYYPLRQGLPSRYSYKTLINLRITELADDVDRLIASGINRGISADRLTKELGVLMSKNDPEFQNVLKRLGPRGGQLRDGMKKVDPNQIPKAKKFLYQARRIAVSEINNAYNEADRLSSELSPVVAYNQWEVSGRHYGLRTTPDSCTMNYETDQYGLGAGVFYPETTPSLMHPFCGCYTTKVVKDPADWLEPNETPKAPRKLNERGYRRRFKGKTTAHRNAQIDRVNEMNRLAYEFYLQR